MVGVGDAWGAQRGELVGRRMLGGGRCMLMLVLVLSQQC